MTRHVSPNSRLTNARTNVRISPKTGRPRKRPARPRLSLTDRLANLHLLLGSSSFRSWPLKVTFYAQDVFRVWQKWTVRDDIRALPPRMEVAVDAQSNESLADPTDQPVGIHALNVDYSSMKVYLEKTKAALEGPSACTCAVCNKSVPDDGHATLFCPNEGCSAAGHIECFATAFRGYDPTTLVPTSGPCPSCGALLQWIDLVKELSLRKRGEKEVQKVLKVRKPRVTKKGTVASEPVVAEDEPSDEEEDLDEGWHQLSDDSEDGKAGLAVRSDPSPGPAFKTSRYQTSHITAYSEPVIEDSDRDSDWEEAMVLT